MEMIQILAFVLLLLGPVLTSICKEAQELELELEAKKRLRSGHQHHALPEAVTLLPASCPVELYRNHASEELAGRSLSPWRYVTRTRPDLIPHKYSEAECLCEGCILFEKGPDTEKRPVLSNAYNSVPVMQSRKFQRKESCGDGKYRLTPFFLNVAVACTCARHKV